MHRVRLCTGHCTKTLLIVYHCSSNIENGAAPSILHTMWLISALLFNYTGSTLGSRTICTSLILHWGDHQLAHKIYEIGKLMSNPLHNKSITHIVIFRSQTFQPSHNENTDWRRSGSHKTCSTKETALISL